MENGELKNLIDELNSESIGVDQLDFNEIVQFITKNYDKFAISKDQEFEKNYCRLLLRSLDDKDIVSVCATLKLIQLNTQLINLLEENYIQCSNQSNYYFVKSCEELIHAEYYKRKLKNTEYVVKNEASDYYLSGKLAVYCVITGNYDEIRAPKHIIPNADYFLFTNNSNIKTDVWTVVHLDNKDELSDVLLQRKTKILGHPLLDKYDYTIYIDGKFEIVGNLKEYIEEYSVHESMLCFPHPSRRTIKDEADAIVSYKKDSRENMDNQIKKYANDGFKDDYGVIETACLVRSNHDTKLKKVMNDWWNEILTCSHRDQMSLPYVCWKNEYCFDYCDMNIYRNELIKHWGHKS